MRLASSPAMLPSDGTTNILTTSRSGSAGGRPLTSMLSLSSGGSFPDSSRCRSLQVHIHIFLSDCNPICIPFLSILTGGC